MVVWKELAPLLMMVMVLVLWFLYFAVCSAPVGAPFIYVGF